MYTVLPGCKSLFLVRKPPAKVTVSADEDVSFRVHIIGSEYNTVTWMKHDAQLELNDKYMWSTTGPDYTLYVNSVRWYDSGRYKCMVDGKLVCQSELVVLASQQGKVRPKTNIVQKSSFVTLKS